MKENLIKLKLDVTGDREYFIGSDAAVQIIQNTDEILALNGLIEYENEDTSKYTRLAITPETLYTLEPADYTDVPGFPK